MNPFCSLRRRTVLGIGSGVIVVAAVASGSFRAAAQPTPGSSSRGIEVSDCRVSLIDKVTLAADLPGILAFVEPREGDAVAADQTVASVKDEILSAAYATAKEKAVNDVEERYARAAADVAKVEVEKAREANRQSEAAVPAIEVQRLQLAHERAVLQIEQAQHQQGVAVLEAKEAEVQLKSTKIQAPFDGVVTMVYKFKGEAVRQGDPILELVSTERVRVEGFVPFSQIVGIRRGTPVRVRLQLNDDAGGLSRQAFDGKVTFVDVVADPVTGDVRVWAEVTNRNNILRAGLTAVMQFAPGGGGVASGER